MSDFLTGLLLGALPAFWQIRQLRAASALCSALQDRDALRICELADTDAALAESRERERKWRGKQRESKEDDDRRPDGSVSSTSSRP